LLLFFIKMSTWISSKNLSLLLHFFLLVYQLIWKLNLLTKLSQAKIRMASSNTIINLLRLHQNVILLFKLLRQKFIILMVLVRNYTTTSSLHFKGSSLIYKRAAAIASILIFILVSFIMLNELVIFMMMAYYLSTWIWDQILALRTFTSGAMIILHLKVFTCNAYWNLSIFIFSSLRLNILSSKI
jgi:hypothetical protein